MLTTSLKIDNDLIKNMKPCNSRLNNYLKYYNNCSHNYKKFINLENITYDDKVWVLRKLLSKTQAVSWAVLCAESVLHIYENKYPYNKAPRKAIEYLKSLDSYELLTEEQIQTLRELRRNTADTYTAAAAAATPAGAAYTSAAAAAAAAIYSATYAADSTYCAVYNATDAVYAATNTTYYDNNNDNIFKQEQQKFNLEALTVVIEST